MEVHGVNCLQGHSTIVLANPALLRIHKADRYSYTVTGIHATFLPDVGCSLCAMPWASEESNTQSGSDLSNEGAAPSAGHH
jgi:hypothetical protein